MQKIKPHSPHIKKLIKKKTTNALASSADGWLNIEGKSGSREERWTATPSDNLFSSGVMRVQYADALR